MIYPCKPFILFEGRLAVIMTGRDYGDCRLNGRQNKALAQIRQLGDLLGAKRIFAPHLGCPDRVAHIHDEDVYHLGDGVFRTVNRADGGIITEPSRDTAMIITNADCHVGVVCHPETNWWALIHLGFDSLVRSGNEGSVLESLLEVCPYDPGSLWIWSGAGVRGCCNGYYVGHQKLRWLNEEMPEIKTNQLIDKGPRQGSVAVDNLEVIKNQTRDFGFGRRDVDGTCTACLTGLFGRMFYSSIFSDQERNCFMVMRIA